MPLPPDEGAEQAAQELQELRDFFDHAPCGLASVDPRGVIVQVNQTLLDWLGYEREELVERVRIFDLVMPESAEALAGYFELFQRQGSIRNVEQSVRRKDGSELPLLLSASMIKDAEGRFVRTRAVLLDVSERKRAEAEIKRLNDRLADALDSVPIALSLSGPDDRLEMLNSTSFKVFPFPKGVNPLGLTLRERVERSAQAGSINLRGESARSFVERRMAYRASPSGYFDLHTADGRSYRISEGRMRDGSTVTLQWEITEDLRREEELRRARVEAEAANRAKSEFLASMSHELRTPLNAILGFTDVLLSAEGSMTPKQMGYLRHVLWSGEHLLRLIDQVLDLARIERGAERLSREPVEVGAVLREVLVALSPAAHRQQVTLALTPTPAALPFVFVDRTRFTQILLNFGSNAIKYNRHGGHVTLIARETEQGQVQISVIDDGPGIPVEQQSLLFQAFQRLGQESGSIEGTGIGLVITKRLAERMDGGVGFTSEPGKGSEFWVRFPAHARPEAADAPEPPEPWVPLARPPSDGRRRLVLYVEDNPINVDLMQGLLERASRFDLITAPTAEQGLELARKRRPDVIVLDINLPGMSGLAAMERLRAMEETRATPVLALSASTEPRDAVRALSAGFAAYLTKPLRLSALLDAIQRSKALKG